MVFSGLCWTTFWKLVLWLLTPGIVFFDALVYIEKVMDYQAHHAKRAHYNVTVINRHLLKFYARKFLLRCVRNVVTIHKCTCNHLYLISKTVKASNRCLQVKKAWTMQKFTCLEQLAIPNGTSQVATYHWQGWLAPEYVLQLVSGQSNG